MVTASKIDPTSPVFVPRYSYAEAEWLAGVSRGTAKRWLRGYTDRRRDGEPQFREPLIQREHTDWGVSFADVVEIAAVRHWRRRRWSLATIRAIVEECRTIFEVERPLITRRFKREAPAVFLHETGDFADLSGPQRKQAWDTIRAFLDTLDYEGDHVSTWWPCGRDVPVAVDPEFGFGLPVVACSGLCTGLRTEFVLEQFQAGETAASIAEDYRLPVQSITAAIDFEVSLSREPA